MAGHADREDNFSDDDLDDLPPNALAELEHNAVRLTQAARAHSQREALPSSDYGEDFDDEDLDDAVVIDEARSAPAIVPALHRATLSQASQREHQALHHQLGTTSSARRQRQEAFLHPPSRDRLPSPASLPHGRSVQVRQGSQIQRSDEAELLRRQLEEVHPSDSILCVIC
jgi:hypothetical protein